MTTANSFSQLPGNVTQHLYIVGLGQSVDDVALLSVAAGQARDSTNCFDIVVAEPLAINFAAVGAGGLDTGTVAINSGYYIYVLYDQTQALLPAAIASLNSVTPVLPTTLGVGYSHYRQVGFITTDGSAELIASTTSTGVISSFVQLNTPVEVLSAGVATTATDVDLSAAVPAVGVARVTLQVDFLPDALGDTATIGNYEMSGLVAAVIQSEQVQTLVIDVAGVPSISYFLSTASAALTLTVLGYESTL
jgi:hypothetical protein